MAIHCTFPNLYRALNENFNFDNITKDQYKTLYQKLDSYCKLYFKAFGNDPMGNKSLIEKVLYDKDVNVIWYSDELDFLEFLRDHPSLYDKFIEAKFDLKYSRVDIIGKGHIQAIFRNKIRITQIIVLEGSLVFLVEGAALNFELENAFDIDNYMNQSMVDLIYASIDNLFNSRFNLDNYYNDSVVDSLSAAVFDRDSYLNRSNVFFNMDVLAIFNGIDIDAMKNEVSGFYGDFDLIIDNLLKNSSMNSSDSFRALLKDYLIGVSSDKVYDLLSAKLLASINKQLLNLKALFPRIHAAVTKIFGLKVNMTFKGEDTFNELRSLYSKLNAYCISYLKVFGSGSVISNETLRDKFINGSADVGQISEILYPEELDVINRLVDLKCYDLANSFLGTKLSKEYYLNNTVKDHVKSGKLMIEEILSEVSNTYEFVYYVMGNHDVTHTSGHINDYYVAFYQDYTTKDEEELKQYIHQEMEELKFDNSHFYDEFIRDIFNNTEELEEFLETLSKEDLLNACRMIYARLDPFRNIDLLPKNRE